MGSTLCCFDSLQCWPLFPKPLPIFLPKVLSVFVGSSIMTLDYPDLNRIAASLFPRIVFSLSPVLDFHSSFCVTFFNLLQIAPTNSVLVKSIQSLITHGLAVSPLSVSDLYSGLKAQVKEPLLWETHSSPPFLSQSTDHNKHLTFQHGRFTINTSDVTEAFWENNYTFVLKTVMSIEWHGLCRASRIILTLAAIQRISEGKQSLKWEHFKVLVEMQRIAVIVCNQMNNFQGGMVSVFSSDFPERGLYSKNIYILFEKKWCSFFLFWQCILFEISFCITLFCKCASLGGPLLTSVSLPLSLSLDFLDPYFDSLQCWLSFPKPLPISLFPSSV